MALNAHITNKPRVYGTGLIALDLIVSAHRSRPVQSWTGGTCGNVLMILTYLGWESFPIARLNGDSASLRVKDDMSSWGVRLDFAEQLPNASTPIIVQRNSHDKYGHPVHKFSWKCPDCGAWLPNFKAVTTVPAKMVASQISVPRVFFFDRVSPAALILAEKCKELGALIFFEPSVKCEPKKLAHALELADVVKYSHERIDSIEERLDPRSRVSLEIKTYGQKGLSFRSRLCNEDPSKWYNLEAPIVHSVVDSCGCGDWATAGIISQLCDKGGGLSLVDKSFDEIVNALNYGQALAAWNCGFEGARGGMYDLSKEEFNREISMILSKKPHTSNNRIGSTKIGSNVFPVCPSCR